MFENKEELIVTRESIPMIPVESEGRRFESEYRKSVKAEYAMIKVV